MASVFYRINRRLLYTGKQFLRDSSFSVWYACLRICDELGGRIGFRRLSEWAHKERDHWILTYLENNLAEVLDVFRNDTNKGVFLPDSPIWVCWWTGEDTAPLLVKKCISSIRKKAGNHQVNLITERNYHKYLSIPDDILKKVQMKKMGFAHLSDYIRSSLLALYGGLWLDATIFCSQLIPEEYFQLPVFTCKSQKQSCRYISEYQWTTFILGGWQGNILYRYLKAAFELYWQKNEYAIDYLFFDYLIKLAIDQVPSVADCINTVPLNNLHRDDLQAAMNAAVSASEYANVIHQDTILYKLSWREEYVEISADGQETVYSYFINKL